MNLLESEVLEVLSEPEHKSVEDVEWWEIRVKRNCYGVINETTLSFSTPEEAGAVEKGYKFMS